MINISERIDSVTVAIYEIVTTIAEQNNIKFFVVGAAARDMVLHYGYGIEIRRATRDIDFAVKISNWEEFDTIKQLLVASGEFTETRVKHRLIYRKNIEVDIVPFGEIMEPDSTISWPPKHEIIMNVLGFEEAYDDAILVRIRDNPELDIRVASPQSMAVLKLLAWNDRAKINSKDALDLKYIMSVYLDAGNHERLHDEHADLVDDDFDYVITGARLLGRDMAKLLGHESLAVVKDLIAQQTQEQDKYSLVEDMMCGDLADDFEANLSLLKSLSKGLSDK